jgi:hypothetical protein
MKVWVQGLSMYAILLADTENTAIEKCLFSVALAEEERKQPKRRHALAALLVQPLSNSPHHSSPFLAIHPHPRHPFHLPDLGAFPCPYAALRTADPRFLSAPIPSTASLPMYGTSASHLRHLSHHSR